MISSSSGFAGEGLSFPASFWIKSEKINWAISALCPVLEAVGRCQMNRKFWESISQLHPERQDQKVQLLSTPAWLIASFSLRNNLSAFCCVHQVSLDRVIAPTKARFARKKVCTIQISHLRCENGRKEGSYWAKIMQSLGVSMARQWTWLSSDTSKGPRYALSFFCSL